MSDGGTRTVRVQVRRVVMQITQDEADLGRNFSQEARGWVTVSHIGRSEHSGNGKADGGVDPEVSGKPR
jgi:hypothetical protein